MVLAHGAGTGGAFGAVEFVSMPGGSAPLHIHAAEDEVLHVLEGRLEVRAGAAVRDAGPGSTTFVPRGMPHGFTNRSDHPACVLALYTPAGPEGWFGEAFRPSGDAGVTEPVEAVLARMRACGARYGITWLPDPPAL